MPFPLVKLSNLVSVLIYKDFKQLAAFNFIYFIFSFLVQLSISQIKYPLKRARSSFLCLCKNFNCN